MDHEDGIIKGEPAAYPQTSSTELESKAVFQSLLNTKFVKGEVRVMDKYPNSDGILEITDERGIQLGKVDIQLKTLSEKNYQVPKHQCERSFFVYCDRSVLPVILIAVNRTEKKAYWRHINKETLIEVFKNMTGDSYSLSITPTNCIDGVDERYISAWTAIYNEVADKVRNSDARNSVLTEQLERLQQKFQNPIRMPLFLLKDIHRFVDDYNYILDKEFPAVKQILYPDYWKIGLGVLDYNFSQIQYVLFPLEYQKDQLLVKEVKYNSGDEITKEMHEGNVLLWSLAASLNDIRNDPTKYAYKQLESRIMEVVGKANLPFHNEQVAHEYLISFIDRYTAYLNMEANADRYSLTQLKFMLMSVLPMMVGSGKGFADWVTEITHGIDSYDRFRPGLMYEKELAAALCDIKEGKKAKVKVTVTSELYNINLIHFYITHLEGKGITETKRIYRLDQYDPKMYGVDPWKTWNKNVLWENLQIFYRDFPTLYNSYIEENFPYLSKHLQIGQKEKLDTLYLLHFDDNHSYTPFLEIYSLRPSMYQKEQKIYFYRIEDADNPIDRKGYYLENLNTCTIGDVSYDIMRVQTEPMKFMFTLFPFYTLTNSLLLQKLREYFRYRTK